MVDIERSMARKCKNQSCLKTILGNDPYCPYCGVRQENATPLKRWPRVIAGLLVAAAVGLLAWKFIPGLPPGSRPDPSVTQQAMTTSTGREEVRITSSATGTPATAAPVTLPVRQGTAIPVSLETITVDNVDQLQELANWGKGKANQVAYSPDGRLLVVASSLGVYVLDADTLEEKDHIEEAGWVNVVDFSPDGKLLATGGKDGIVRLWKVSDWVPVSSLDGGSPITTIDFHPNGQLLISGSENREVLLWQAADGSLAKTYSLFDRKTYALEFSPDGNKLVASGDDILRVYEFNNSAKSVIELWNLSFGYSGLQTFSLSSDGTSMAVKSSYDGSLYLRSMTNGKIIDTIQYDHTRLSSLSYSFDGSFLAVSVGGALNLLSMPNPIRYDSDNVSFDSNKGNIKSIVFSPANRNMVLLTDSGAIELRRVEDGALEASLDGFLGEYIGGISISPDRNYLAIGSGGATHLWRFPDGYPYSCHGGVYGLEFLADSQIVAYARGNTLFLQKVSDGSVYMTYDMPSEGLNFFAFSDNGQMLAIKDPTRIRVLNLVNGNITMDVYYSDYHTKIEFSRDGSKLFAINPVRIREYNVHSGEFQETIQKVKPFYSGFYLSLSPDEEVWAIDQRYADGLNLYSASDWSLLKTTSFSGVLSRDWKMLVNASKDGTIHIYGIPSSTNHGQSEPADGNGVNLETRSATPAQMPLAEIFTTPTPVLPVFP